MKQKNKGGRPKIDDKEKLRNEVRVYINDLQLDQLCDWVAKTKKTQSDVIRSIAFEKKVRLITESEADFKIVFLLADILEQIRGVCANLNQLSRQANSTREAKKLNELAPDISQAIDDLKETKDMIYNIGDFYSKGNSNQSAVDENQV
jgi:predicted house-cleaning noncanonical NTP pyrophosphatase (MazG superfamily)